MHAIQRAEVEHDRIQDAIIALVAERGLEATTVELIAERAGVSVACFETYFADKQKCFDLVFEELLNAYISGARQAFATCGPWRDRLRAATYFGLRTLENDAAITRFVMVGALSGGEIALARRDRMVAFVVDLVDPGRRELEDPDSVPRAMAEGAVGAAYELIVAATIKGTPQAWREVAPRFMYLAVLPYLGEEAAQEELRRGPAELARYLRGEIYLDHADKHRPKNRS